jgi:uncharacterized protein YaaW (UPF0174 family)
MAYRHDPDLEFLGSCENEELDALVQVLTHDPKDNKKRYTENLTSKDGYKNYYPKHTMYWQDIAEEIQRFGGNTIANIARKGQGVLYREVLLDVCNHLKVKFPTDLPLALKVAKPFLSFQLNKTNHKALLSTSQLERYLLEHLTKQYIEKLAKDDPEELKKVAERLDIKDFNNIPPAALVLAVQAALASLFSVSVPMAVVFVYNPLGVIVEREIVMTTLGTLLSTTSIGKLLVRFNPIIAGVMALWTVNDIAAPAMRVTVPAVVQIALLRAIKSAQNENISTISGE